MEERKEFLITMYETLNGEMTRHIQLTWQAVTVVIGSLAALVLAQTNLLNLDIGTSIIFLLTFWMYAHVIDANYWYNRNLVIIANIERLFLEKDDLKKVHYYFGKHRSSNSILTDLRIQIYLCIGLFSIITFNHIFNNLTPLKNFFISISHLQFDLESFKISFLLPYILLAIFIYLLRGLHNKRIKDYKEFLKNSPGIDINSDDIVYGTGHPTD
jgi:hypothetical protein